MTIPLERGERAQALLRANPHMTTRELASAAGISRATALSIIKGKWRPARGRQPLRPLLDTTRPAVRCPTCGGMVYLPCWLCRIRSLREEPAAK